MSSSSSFALTLRRSFSRGWKTLFRERGSMKSLPALAGLLLLLQVLLLVALGTNGIYTLLRTQPELSVEMQSGIPDRSIQEFLVAARARPDVLGVTYVTREKALAAQREADPGLSQFLDGSLVQNPFSDTVIVTLKNADTFGGFVAFTRQDAWTGVIAPAFFTDVSLQQASLGRTLWIASAVRLAAIAMLALTALVLLVAVSELARRRAASRRDDVFVAQMTGADPRMIRLPFATELTVLLMFGLVLSAGIVAFFVLEFSSVLPFLTGSALWKELSWMVMRYGPVLLAGEVVAMAVIGVMGTRLAVQAE